MTYDKDTYAFNFLKYCLRYEFQNNFEDLDKARSYLEALIEFVKSPENEANYQSSKTEGAASVLSENMFKNFISQIELKNPPLAEILTDFTELYFNRLEQNALYYAGFEARFELFYRPISARHQIEKYWQEFEKELEDKENQKEQQ